MADLSPAAQAVFNAAWGILAETESPWLRLAEEIAAAALRAAADQVLPAPYAYASQDLGLVRDELLSIAEELDSTS
jgi:hypothetical protein